MRPGTGPGSGPDAGVRPGKWSASRPEARVTPGTGFTVFLLIVVAVLLTQSATLAPLSRIAPLAVLVPTAGMTIVQLVRDLRSGSDPGTTRPPATAIRRRQIRIALWIGGVAVLVYLLGYLIASAVFLLLYVRSESSLGWGRSFLVTVATVSLIYVVFGVLAGLRLPEGAVF